MDVQIIGAEISDETAESFFRRKKIVRTPTKKTIEKDTDENKEIIVQILRNLSKEMAEMSKDMKDNNVEMKKSIDSNNQQLRSIAEETRKEVEELKIKHKQWELNRGQDLDKLEEK